MNETPRQLNDRYKGQLLWINLKDRRVILGELQGGTGWPGEQHRESGPINLTVWKIDVPIAYFNHRAGIPLSSSTDIHPSEIKDMEPLLWMQPGGAEQLFRLAKDRWLRITTLGKQEWHCIITGPFDAFASAARKLPETIQIAEIPTRQAFSEYQRRLAAGDFFQLIGHTLQINEIVIFQVMGDNF